MEILRKFIFTIVFYLGFYINPSLSQGVCQSYTYFDVPGAQPLNPVSVNSTNCLSICFNNSTCNGFTQQSGYCQLNTGNPNDINYNVSDTIIYSALVRNANSCNTPQNCLYNWAGSKNVHGQQGQQNAMTTINSCIGSCQQNSICTALDWDTNQKSCWIFTVNGPATTNASGVYHFVQYCIPFTTVPSSSATLPITPITTSLLPFTGPTFFTPNTTASTTASPCQPQCTGDRVCNASSLQCVCNTICPAYYSPVCGSDNETYDNACKLGEVRCLFNLNTTISYYWECGAAPPSDSESSGWYPMAIDPAYIVLAGVGGGCLLLVITAVIILCGYPMNRAETYSTNATLVNTNGAVAQEQINMEGVGGDNVEFNPYYNKSEIGAPDFTKEENIM